MRKNRIACLMAGIMILASLAGCGAAQDIIPYPEGYYIPRAVEEETDATPDGEDTAAEEVRPARTAEGLEDVHKKGVINFFLDTSGSMARSPEVVKIHSAATKCAAGYTDRHFYSIENKSQLIETTEELALSGKYGRGAPLDLLHQGTLPFDPNGVNVITTDLQSSTSCTELGRWLVETGCTGYSFYVFTMQYDGSLEFRSYTSSQTLETVSIKGCSFKDKEFLMVVFGRNELVEAYDSFFKSKIDPRSKYDMCHVSLHDSEEQLGSFLHLTSSRCFTDDIANVELDNTNFVYGLALIEDDETEFTCDNTFVYRKSRYSSSKAKQAVKAVLYAVPEGPVPAVEKTAIQVLEFDSDTGTYEASKVPFQVSTQAYIDGLPSAADETDPESYERLNTALGGAIVPEGPVFSVSVVNESLPRGLYAVEVQITFEAAGEVTDLQKFSASHSAGLEQYSAALKDECEAKIVSGKTSTSKFIYTGGNTSSVFRKLLEFERVTDELIAAGAVTETNSQMITVRLIIDNRK